MNHEIKVTAQAFEAFTNGARKWVVAPGEAKVAVSDTLTIAEDGDIQPRTIAAMVTHVEKDAFPGVDIASVMRMVTEAEYEAMMGEGPEGQRQRIILPNN